MTAVPPIGSTLNLVLHAAILTLLLTGFTFARRKKFMVHEKWMFSGIVLAGVSFFVWMAPSYISNFKVVLAEPNSPGVIITNLHVILGATTGVLALYIIARMKLDLPARFTVNRVKRLMRTTLSMWLLTFLVGVLFYVYYFVF